MGLAASQARLLFLTARQNDVEGQLMRVSNQKLALSREAADLSREYADSMNATKLTWDTNTDDGAVDLTYDLLMHPNTVGDYSQYIITNTANGKVILDNDYINTLGIAAAGGAGDIANMSYVGSDGTTYTGMQAFIMKMVGCDAATVNSYIEAGNFNTDTGNYTINYNDTEIITNSIGLDAYSGNTTLYPERRSENYSYDTTEVLDNFTKLLKEYSSSLSRAIISSVSGSVGSEYIGMMQDAAEYAYAATYAKFVYNIVDADSTDGAIQSSDGKTMNNTQPEFGKNSPDDQNRIVIMTRRRQAGLGKRRYVKGEVDNSQVIDTYLNFFDKYLAEHSGFGSDYVSGNTIGASTTTRSSSGTGSNTGSTNPTSDVEQGDADLNSNQVDDAYEASFYINLYNALLAHGWQLNSNVDNKEYLHNQVLYGNITIKGYVNGENDEGSWGDISTSGPYSPLKSKKDDETVTEAENEYKAVKDLLDFKETELDIKFNDLDTERSAVVTEIESVKSLIKKDVEVFKMFEA